MKRSKKVLLQKQKEEKIAIMEYEDSVGIRRKRFKPTYFTVERIIIIKIVLLISAIVFYFVFSPLLIAIFSLYAALYFITKHTESNENYGVKKEQRVRIFKADAFFALMLVAFCVGGTLLSDLTTSTKGSMFEGRSKASIRAVMEERGMSTSSIDSMIERMEENGMFLTSTEKSLLKIATCYTGHREFFVTKNSMALRVGFRLSGGRRFSGSPPSGAVVRPNEDGQENRNFNFSSVPFSMIINQLIFSISFIMMIGVFLSGIITITLNLVKKKL